MRRVLTLLALGLPACSVVLDLPPSPATAPAETLVHPYDPDAVCLGVAAFVGDTPFDDLQTAIDSMESGGAVDICPGLHLGPFVVRGPGSFTIRSYDGSPHRTRLTSSGSAILEVLDATGLDLTVEGLTLADAKVDERAMAAGIVANGLDRLTLRNIVATGNRHAPTGSEPHRSIGVIGADALEITIEDSAFQGNSGDTGGVLALTADHIRLTGNTFGFNGSLDASVGFLRGDTIELHDNALIANRSELAGALRIEALGRLEILGLDAVGNTGGMFGAVSIHGQEGAEIMVADSLFDANTTSGSGGGLATEGGLVSVARTIFSDNRAGERGGGWCAERGAVSVTDGTTFVGNTSGRDGGGLAQERVEIHVDKAVFEQNSSEGAGGGMWSKSPLSLAVSDTLFRGNTAQRGAGAVELVSFEIWGDISGTGFQGNVSRGLELGAGALAATSNSTSGQLRLVEVDAELNAGIDAAAYLFGGHLRAFLLGGSITANRTDAPERGHAMVIDPTVRLGMFAVLVDDNDVASDISGCEGTGAGESTLVIDDELGLSCL